MSDQHDMALAFNAARQKVLNGEQLSIEEQQKLIAAIRGQRFAAAESGAKARTKKAADRGISDDQLDAELGDLGL